MLRHTLWLPFAVLESDDTHMEKCIFLLISSIYLNISLDMIPPPPPSESFIFELHATYSCLPGTYYPSGKCPFFCKGLLNQAGQMGNLFLLLVSYQLLFPKACELSVAFLKGSCWATHRNIFSIWWCRIWSPSTPDKSLFGQASRSCL